ncbi:zf-HC2 domain-containing protein [Streptomyces anulatus]|uniref:zf-HC2 domain-containing protein n=1 Tax=Streptomyces anulatus TaxID=1892 RepID=UPI000997B7F3
MANPAAGCDEIREWLGAYVIGALEPGEDVPVQAHLTHCPACRSERDDLADVVRLLHDALPLPAEAHGARPPRSQPRDQEESRESDGRRRTGATGQQPTRRRTRWWPVPRWRSRWVSTPVLRRLRSGHG